MVRLGHFRRGKPCRHLADRGHSEYGYRDIRSLACLLRTVDATVDFGGTFGKRGYGAFGFAVSVGVSLTGESKRRLGDVVSSRLSSESHGFLPKTPVVEETHGSGLREKQNTMRTRFDEPRIPREDSAEPCVSFPHNQMS